MKPLLLSILAAFLLFVPNAAAHTYLDTTNPEDGTTMTTPLQTIELTYSGQIEEGSTFIVTGSNGVELRPQNVSIEDGVITGTFAEPLTNDSYVVSWNSISEDGHPLSGQFSFTVNAAEEAVTSPVEEVEATDEEVEVQADTPATPESTTTNEQTANEENEASGLNPLLLVGAILLAIIFISIIALVMRKRK